MGANPFPCVDLETRGFAVFLCFLMCILVKIDSKGVQLVPKALYHSGFFVPKALYHSGFFTKNLQLPTMGFEPWSSHTAVRHVTARPLRRAL